MKADPKGGQKDQTGLGGSSLRSRGDPGGLESRAGLVPCARQWSWFPWHFLVPTAKPTNWIEGTHTVLRARKGGDDKVLVATCTSANGKPPSVVSWETRLKGEAEYQEIRNPNGTVTVISRYRLVPSREAHRQTLACIVNYHMDRFKDSLTLNVQCEQGLGGRHCPPSHPPFPSPSASLCCVCSTSKMSISLSLFSHH